MKAIVLLLSSASLTFIGCATGRQCLSAGYGYVVPNGTHYAIQADHVSPSGIHFDPTSQIISGALLDRLTGEAETCLGKPIDRSSFVVKVPSDWSLSCAGDQQLLSAEAPHEGCDVKGIPVSPECPCRWRALIQCPNVIVTTPSLYLYKDALVRFVVGTTDPWHDPKLIRCVEPSTGPLSLGTP